MLIPRLWIRGKRIAAMMLTSACLFGCVHAAQQNQAEMEARAMGKYSVHLTTEQERERVLGTCKYVTHIVPDDDTLRVPADNELPDYFREKAVLAGADTVVVDGRTGEAYICGPGALNPDGTRRGSPDAVK